MTQIFSIEQLRLKKEINEIFNLYINRLVSEHAYMVYASHLAHLGDSTIAPKDIMNLWYTHGDDVLYAGDVNDAIVAGEELFRFTYKLYVPAHKHYLGPR